MHEDLGAPVSGETEARISHFIPSVELKGSRYEKIQKLDVLIDYLELGVAPGYAAGKASLSVPVKVALSLANYYELNMGTAPVPVFVDHKFGYFSVAGLVTVPIGGTTGFGAWNLHGGVELQTLGDTTKAFNGGDGHRFIVSGGLGFSY